MRFDRYMEKALYHPEHGYYAGKARIGREGDFFTSVSVGPLFGSLLARQAVQMRQLLGGGNPFWIIEQGAHDGQLAVDILKAIRDHSPDFFRAIRYLMIEPSATRRETQKRGLTEASLIESVHWIERMSDWRGEKPGGLFLSNELVDAFPVRLIRRYGEAWRERHVGLGTGETFAWADLPVEDVELQHAIEGLPLPEVEDYVTEIGLVARNWMKDVAQFLGRGYVVTFDYGIPASIYYAPFRIAGTLTTYYQHRRGDDVLHAPGEVDITSHVDFTALAQAGEAGGLTTLGFIDQQRFLMGVAHDELSAAVVYPEGIPQHQKAWNTLTHPGHLGSRFQVLVQAKDAPGGLDGLRYARPHGLN